MPTYVSCVYECDGCHTRMSGVVGTLPNQWNNGGRLARGVARAATVYAQMVHQASAPQPYVFCSETCSEKHEAKLKELGHK